MKIIDANVLLYVVNKDSVHHDKLLLWWHAAVTSDESLGLSWIVILAFLRIATNPRIFARPLETSEAIQTVDEWLALPNIALLREKDGHWDSLRTILETTGTAGNLTTDAHLAAFALTHDAALVSCDSDFGRFKGLRWENPLG